MAGSIATTAPFLPAQPVERRALGARVDRRADRATGRLAAGEELLGAVDDEQRRPSGEDAVLRPLESGRPVDERVEAGDGRVQRAVGVDAQVAEGVAGLLRPGHGVRADEDRSALAVVLLEQHPLVARPVAVVAREDHLDDRDVDEQRDQHEREDEGDAADGPAHTRRTTWVTASSGDGVVTSGRRARSEMRRSSATMIQLAMSDDPP